MQLGLSEAHAYFPPCTQQPPHRAPNLGHPTQRNTSNTQQQHTPSLPPSPSCLQARHAYLPADVRMNERFASVGLRTNTRGTEGLDLTAFDDTWRADIGMGARCGVLGMREKPVHACMGAGQEWSGEGGRGEERGRVL